MASKGQVFAGCTVALVTPLRDGEVDTGALRRMVDWQIDQGTTILSPAGTTGEAPTLTRHRARAGHRRRDRTGRGQGSRPGRHGLVLDRRSRPAHPLCRGGRRRRRLVVAPYYNRPTQEGLYAICRIAEASPLPLVLYNVPDRTGCHLEPQTVERLDHVDNIVAIKEASGSVDQASEILCRTELTVLSGNDTLTLPMLAVGAEGVISIVANLVPKEMIALVDAFRREDYSKARRMHTHLFPLCQALMNLAPNPIAVKTALALIGQGNGELRLPLTPPDVRLREQLSVILSCHGLRVHGPARSLTGSASATTWWGLWSSRVPDM